MRENPVVTFVKFALLVVIGILLVFNFIAQNDTQTKVIRTAEDVAAVRDQIADLRRTIQQGGGTTAVERRGPAVAEAPKGPRIPGFTPLLSDEADPPRAADDRILWDAQWNSALPVEPKGFNILTSDRDRYVAVDLGNYVYVSLGERKDANKDEFKPGLAEWAEVSPDRLEYHFWLRKGVRWHRPPVDLTSDRYKWMRGDHEVTAEDVTFVIDMILNENADTGQLRAGFEGKIESYEAIDPWHIKIRWKKADFYATGLLMSLTAMPKWIYTREEDGSTIDAASQGQRFAAHWFNKKMCGYGSYVFSEYKLNDYIRLERSEDYWGRRPAFRYIYYKLNLRDDEPRYNFFMRRGEDGQREQFAYPISSVRWKRDVIDNDGSSALLQQLKNRELHIWGYQRMMYAYAGWACRGKFFSDKRVRRAMTMAANRPMWMKDILLDTAICPTGIAYSESPEYDKTVEPWPYDLQAAAKLLDEAGWTDADGNGVREKVIDGVKTEFRFNMLQTPGSPEIDAIRADWEQSLRKIGVIMEPDVVEWNQFIKRSKDRVFDSYFGAWFHGDEFDPEYLFHSKQIETPGSSNYVEWGTKRGDEIIDLLPRTFDLKERYRLCHELHRIFHDEQPYTNTWSWKNPVAIDAKIGGMRNPRAFSPQIDIRNLWMERDPVDYGDGRDQRPKR